MKIWKSLSLFSACDLLLAAVSSLIAYYTKGAAHRIFIFTAQFLILILAIRLTAHLLKSAKSTGKQLFRSLLEIIRTGFRKANLAVTRFANRHGVRIRNYQDKIEMISVFKKTKRHLFPVIRWRDMNTDDQKVRYIYIKYIQKAIRMGFRFKTAETPNEIGVLLSRLEKLSNEQLFTLYNRARYAKQSGITKEDVQDLLASAGLKHRKT